MNLHDLKNKLCLLADKNLPINSGKNKILLLKIRRNDSPNMSVEVIYWRPGPYMMVAYRLLNPSDYDKKNSDHSIGPFTMAANHRTAWKSFSFIDQIENGVTWTIEDVAQLSVTVGADEQGFYYYPNHHVHV